MSVTTPPPGLMPSINGVSVCFSASSGITSSPTMKFDARPTDLYSRKLSRHGVQPYSGISPEWTTMFRRKADLDFLAFCVLEETTRTTADDLDEDGAERPRLLRAVMDQHSRPGPELTTLEAVGDQWRYALVVQAGDDDDGWKGISSHATDLVVYAKSSSDTCSIYVLVNLSVCASWLDVVRQLNHDIVQLGPVIVAPCHFLLNFWRLYAKEWCEL